MSNRLLQRLQAAKRNHQKIFSAFLTLGYPSLKDTKTLIEAFEQAGVDVIELGFPFSDPLADGPTIQFSSQQALENGVRMHDAFRLVSGLRKKGVTIPIIFFSYLNPVYHYGIKIFPKEAVRAGFDGLLIPDLPPEEEKELTEACRRSRLPQVYLVAPTTSEQRAGKIGRASEGFVYYVSLRGVTGARKAVSGEVNRQLRKLNKKISKPLLVGFGVSNPKQVKKIKGDCAGIIVGSAIIEKIRRSENDLKPAIRYVRQMVRAVRNK